MGSSMLAWLGVLYGALIGSALASFACVVSERVPAGRSINGRSHCVCGRKLGLRDNIPVVGWLAARGTARCCGATLPARYVLWELAYGLWGALVFGWVWHRAVTGSLTVPVLLAGLAGFGAFFAVVLRATWQRSTDT